MENGNMIAIIVTMPVHVPDGDGTIAFPNYLQTQTVHVKVDEKETEYDILKKYYIGFYIRNVVSISHHDMPISDGHHFTIRFGENGKNELDMLPENLMTLYVATNPNDPHIKAYEHHDNYIKL